MLENPQPDEAQALPELAPQTAQTAGQLLKAARLRAGVHLAVLSVNLKIPVRQLEALEADQYLMDQSPVFVRGLASSVCRHLRTDPAPILSLLPHGGTYLEPHGAVRQAHVRPPADFGRLRNASPRIPARAGWAAASMLAMIAALIWLPGPADWAWLDALSAQWTSSTERAVMSEPDAQAATAASEAATLGAVSVVPSETTALPGAAGAASAPAPVTTPTTGVQPAVATPNTPPVASSAPTAVASALQFEATDTSWIEVRDNKNQVLWSGVLKAGDRRPVSAAQAVNVVIGRADAVRVTVKGQTFDLKPHTKVNVARFEVQP